MSERDITPTGLPFPIKPKMIVIVVLVIALIALGLSSFFVVDQKEQAVVLFLGKFSRLADPGLNFKVPFLEKNYNVPTKEIQTQSFGYRTEKAGITTIYSAGDYPDESIMLTGDLNIIDVEWSIQYLIVDPKAWLFNVEYKIETIRDISQSIMNQLVGDRTILDVIGPERTTIEHQAELQMNKLLNDYGLGINIITVKLRNIVPPKASVQDAFEDVNKAIQDMNRLINEGQEQFNREIPKAEGEAAQLVQIAQGYAAERVNEARGDVSRFSQVWQEYRRNPSVTRTRLYIEMIEEVFSREEGTDLIDRNLENFIPLKTLQSQGGIQ